VEDLVWDFEAAVGRQDWLRVGFSAWLHRLPDDALRDAFLDQVPAGCTQVVGSATVVRVPQLLVELRAT
jgi:hypothetical protein